MGVGGGGALFLNFVYAHSGANCILMIVASKFSVYAEHHYCICNEYFVFVLLTAVILIL